MLAKILVCLLIPLTAGASLRDGVGFDEFEALVRQKTGEIPELRELWTREPGLYLTGSQLRGLLTWLSLELESHPAEEVRNLTAPSVWRLRTSPLSDVDLVVPDGAPTPLPGADVLDETFYRRLVTFGGPTLGKIRVRPDRIEDPYGALRAYYEGRLEFVPPPSEAYARHPLRDRGFTRTAEALRFLRMLFEHPYLNGEGARPKIRQIPWLEPDLRSERERFFISKTLNRLWLAARRDPVRFQAALDRFGLTAHLERNGFVTTPDGDCARRLSEK